MSDELDEMKVTVIHTDVMREKAAELEKKLSKMAEPVEGLQAIARDMMGCWVSEAGEGYYYSLLDRTAGVSIALEKLGKLPKLIEYYADDYEGAHEEAMALANQIEIPQWVEV